MKKWQKGRFFMTKLKANEWKKMQLNKKWQNY